MADVDWKAVRTEYVTTDISQRKLAEKHGIPYGTLKRRCADEKWVNARETYDRKVVAKTIEKTSDREANKLAKLIATTDKAIDVVAKAFEDENQFNRYLVETTEEYSVPEFCEEADGDSHVISMRRWTEEQQFAKVDTKALKDLTTVLKDLTTLVRNLHGIPTQAEAESQRIAAERLKLEQHKADADNNGPDTIEVVFSAAGPEEWNE